MSTIAVMGRKRETNQAKADRHKPRKMVAIRKQYHHLAEQLAVRLGCSDLTELANIALRELLEKHELWPPPKEQP
jgi:hypothetical protein